MVPNQNTQNLYLLADDKQCYHFIAIPILHWTEYEALLEKISPKLASTHYIALTVKKYLGDLYGFVKGYRYPELPEEKLLAKIKYLREFVDTISKADPVSNK